MSSPCKTAGCEFFTSPAQDGYCSGCFSSRLQTLSPDELDNIRKRLAQSGDARAKKEAFALKLNEAVNQGKCAVQALLDNEQDKPEDIGGLVGEAFEQA